MQCTEYEKRAAELLSRICYATVATADKHGRPWNSPVAAVYDSDLTIYWFSDRMSQHSQNVRDTKYVFIVIYDSTLPEGSGAKGVYLRAQAREVVSPVLVRHARRLKKGDSDPDDVRTFSHTSVRRVYMAKPSRIWMNNVEKASNGTFIRDYRVELSIQGVCNELMKIRQK